MKKITYKQVREIFLYKKGNLYWNKKIADKVIIGRIAGSIKRGPYILITVFRKDYSAHRLVWFYFHKRWPKRIDHIDGNKLNNSIENLRDVSPSENSQNMISHIRGRLVGTCFIKNRNLSKPWEAKAPRNYLGTKTKNGKYLGYYKTEKEAHEAVVKYCKKNGS